MKTPGEIVKIMMESDVFSQWLHIDVIETGLGACVLTCPVLPEMLNGFGILHGGISYSLADSALAFASNSYGYKCVSIETSISHTRPAQTGDVLTARCTESHRGKTLGIYQVEVKNQHDKTVALFKGTVKVSDETW